MDLIDQDFLELQETILFSLDLPLNVDKAHLLLLYFREKNEIKDPYVILQFLEEDSLGLVKQNKNLQNFKNYLKNISGKFH